MIRQPAIWKLERQKVEANEVGRVPLLSEMKVMAATENFGVTASANQPQSRPPRVLSAATVILRNAADQRRQVLTDRAVQNAVGRILEPRIREMDPRAQSVSSLAAE